MYIVYAFMYSKAPERENNSEQHMKTGRKEWSTVKLDQKHRQRCWQLGLGGKRKKQEFHLEHHGVSAK